MEIGTKLGPYKIIEQLGAGGMGEVYLGEDTRLGRKVAIKVLPTEFAGDPGRLARFEQEARAAAALMLGVSLQNTPLSCTIVRSAFLRNCCSTRSHKRPRR